MGRWRTDVLALACIAGGAVVGAGVTAGLAARGSGPAPHGAEVACGSASSSQVVVRIRDGETSPRSVRIVRSGSCASPVTVDLAEVRERMDRARARAEVARIEADEVRVQMEAVRQRLEAARHEVMEVEVPLPAEMREQAHQARLEALETLLESLGEQLESSLEGEDIEASLEALRSALRQEVEQAVSSKDFTVVRVSPGAGSGGND